MVTTRRDPHTGVPVLTEAGFWAHEAQAEGRGRIGSDLRDDFLAELDAEMAAECARLRENALATLQQAVRDWNAAEPDDVPIPVPDAVDEVLEADVSVKFRSNRTHLKARVRSGTVTGVLTFTEAAWSGSWDEPPDCDVNVVWEAA